MIRLTVFFFFFLKKRIISKNFLRNFKKQFTSILITVEFVVEKSLVKVIKDCVDEEDKDDDDDNDDDDDDDDDNDNDDDNDDDDGEDNDDDDDDDDGDDDDKDVVFIDDEDGGVVNMNVGSGGFEMAFVDIVDCGAHLEV